MIQRLTFGMALLLLLPAAAFAQCTFTPTVTPGSPVLCPNESDTLWTQVYDSYQWYRDGVPIPGATQQFLVVGPNDLIHYFLVEVTDENCTEKSDSVLVDGWVFLLPTAMSVGDFTIVGEGVAYVCDGDSMSLIFMPPYELNIQWYNNASPIPGATDDTLVVTGDGNYWACGSPALCPNYNDCLGVQVPVEFADVPNVIIMQLQNGDLVFTPPPGCNFCTYQWYKNGNIMTGETGYTLAAPGVGSYTVEVTDSVGCTGMSTPFVVNPSTGIDENETEFSIYPNPASDFIAIEGNIADIVTLQVYDVTGRTMNSRLNGQMLNIAEFPAGHYTIMISRKDGKMDTFRFIKM